MGWFPPTAGARVRAQIEQLADGEVSPVFQSDVGFHFIKRLARASRTSPRKTGRNQAREIIGQRKSEGSLRALLAQPARRGLRESRLGSGA
jgi:peptidyl-prolyl cis-trans isomerase SurA